MHTSQGVVVFHPVRTPQGAKDWYARNYHISHELAITSLNPVKMLNNHEWAKLLRLNRSFNALFRWTGDNSDIWGNKGWARIWNKHGWDHILYGDGESSAVRKLELFCTDMGFDRRLFSLCLCTRFSNVSSCQSLVLITRNPKGEPIVLDSSIVRPAFVFHYKWPRIRWESMECFDTSCPYVAWRSMVNS